MKTRRAIFSEVNFRIFMQATEMQTQRISFRIMLELLSHQPMVVPVPIAKLIPSMMRNSKVFMAKIRVKRHLNLKMKRT